MKFILINIFLISHISASTFSVIERKDNSTKTFIKKAQLEDLRSTTHFDGKYFKIVNKKSNEPISFSDDKKLVNKAANVYFHLSRAKSFWMNTIKSTTPQMFPQLTIRLDITNNFNELGHYSNDNLAPQFNNALSIPEGTTPDWVPSDKFDTWGKEIWFRPMKKVSTKGLTDHLGPNPIYQSLSQLQAPFLNYTIAKFNQTIMNHLIYPHLMPTTFSSDFTKFIGTIALTVFVVEASKRMDPLFVENWFYIDTAMVPEIIYHEYSHLILSDYLEMSHSTPVVEGYADYFAAIMSNKRKVYDRVKGYSNSDPKDTEDDKHYHHTDEHSSQATSDFVLSVLWDVRDTLGPEVADKVIYESRKKLDTRSATIGHHMIRAILDTCSEICPSPRKNRLELYKMFGKRGF